MLAVQMRVEPLSRLTLMHDDETGGADMTETEKPSLGLIEGKEALDVESLRDLYVSLTGKEPTPEDLAEAKAVLDETKAEDAAKAKS
jgi:hypothetical protein